MARKIDLGELSGKMGVSRYLLLDWLKLGLPHERTSRGYRFDFDQVVRWHNSQVERVIEMEGASDDQRTI